MSRAFPIVVATRVKPGDQVLIDAACQLEGVTVAMFVRRTIVLEAARVVERRVKEVAASAT